MEDFNLFQGKSFSNLLEDIYNNQVNKQKEIRKLIEDIRVMVRHPGDLEVIGPIIKDLVDTSVKNDDHLIKIAAIAQRIMATNAKLSGTVEEGNISISPEEKQALIAQRDDLLKELETEADKVEDDLEVTDDEVDKIQKKVNKVKGKKDK